jgi:hypothetical protein
MFWLAGVFVILLIMAFGTLAYLAYRVIDEKPIYVPEKIPDMDSSASVYKKLDLAGALMSSFKKQRKGAAADKARTVELTEQEVNAVLISTLVFAQQAMSGKDGANELRDAFFYDGAFTLMLSRKMNFKTPFGSYLNLKVTFVPGIKDNHLSAEARGIRIGDLDVPVSFIRDNIAIELYKVEKSPEGQAVLDIVSELKVEKGKMTIVYSPDKLLKLMMQKGLVDGGMLGGGVAPGKER